MVYKVPGTYDTRINMHIFKYEDSDMENLIHVNNIRSIINNETK